MLSMFNVIKSMANGNPQMLAQNMMNQNPQFRQFVQSNQGKTIQQIARENNIDFNALNSILGNK
jgi:hypothetical protein